MYSITFENVKHEVSNTCNLKVFQWAIEDLSHRIINKCLSWQLPEIIYIFQPPCFMNEDAESREVQ